MGITNPSQEYFKDGSWGWDGTQWRKLPLLWGYSDRWAEDLGGTVAADGAYTGASAVVPAGWIYRIEIVSARNITGARGRMEIKLHTDALVWRVEVEMTPAQYEPTIIYGPLTLKAGDKVEVAQQTCLAGDVVQAVVWGHKMQVA